MNRLKFWWDMEFLHGFKVPPYKTINYQGEKSNFTVEKPCRHLREWFNLPPVMGPIEISAT